MLSHTSQPPLVFVQLGPELPRYGASALRFAARNFEGNTLLLTDGENLPKSGGGYRVEGINSWYQREPFLEFEENSKMDGGFRNGFWFHAVERFFVIQQFMEREGLNRVFHAELDVMVLDISGVAEFCDANGSGIFAVMDDPSRALASFFYVNSRQCFQDFLQFVVRNAHAGNEMVILGKFLQERSDCGHSLPSDRFFDREVHPLSPASVPDSIGLFDASALGQWLFGADQRNLGGPSRNKFRSKMATYQIEKLYFSLRNRKTLIASMPGGEARQIRTLHVHSKIVSQLTFLPILRFYLLVNRMPLRVITTGRVETLRLLLLRWLLRERGLLLAFFLVRIFGRAGRYLLRYLAEGPTVRLSARQSRRLSLLLSTGSDETDGLT